MCNAEYHGGRGRTYRYNKLPLGFRRVNKPMHRLQSVHGIVLYVYHLQHSRLSMALRPLFCVESQTNGRKTHCKGILPLGDPACGHGKILGNMMCIFRLATPPVPNFGTFQAFKVL